MKILYQHKQAGKKQHTIKLVALESLRVNAIHQGDRYPVYMFEFDEDKHSYYVINEVLFGILKEYIDELE